MADKTKYLLFGEVIYSILFGLYFVIAVFFSNTIIGIMNWSVNY